MLHGARDRVQAVTILGVTVGVAGLAGVFLLTPPARASWPYVIASGLLHVGYDCLLAWAYRSAELSQAYPIARGFAPLLVMVGGAVFAHEILPPLSLAGVTLIAGGVVSLGLHSRARLAGVLAALLTGLMIASYSVIDALGVRLSGTVAGYTAWDFAFEILLLPAFLLRGSLARLTASPAEMLRGVSAGRVLLEPAIAQLGETKPPLDDLDRRLALRPPLGFGRFFTRSPSSTRPRWR